MRMTSRKVNKDLLVCLEDILKKELPVMTVENKEQRRAGKAISSEAKKIALEGLFTSLGLRTSAFTFPLLFFST